MFPLINSPFFVFLLHKLRHLRSSQSSRYARNPLGSLFGHFRILRYGCRLRWFALHHFSRNEKFNAFGRWAWNDNWGKQWRVGNLRKSQHLNGNFFSLIFDARISFAVERFFMLLALNCLGLRAIIPQASSLSVIRHSLDVKHRDCWWIVYR